MDGPRWGSERKVLTRVGPLAEPTDGPDADRPHSLVPRLVGIALIGLVAAAGGGVVFCAFLDRVQARRAIRRIGAIEAAGPASSQDVEFLIRSLLTEDDVVRTAADEALGRITDPGVVALAVRAAWDAAGGAKTNPAEALGKVRNVKTIQLLTRVLGAPDELVQRTVAQALLRIGDAAVDPLTEALCHGGVGMRINAARALGRIGDGRSIKPLVGRLGDKSRSVRAAVAEALVRLGRPAVVPLIRALRQEDVVVRAEAARALGKTGDPRAGGPLADALDDRDPRLRALAAQSLREVGWEPGDDAEEAKLHIAERNAQALLGMRGLAAGPLAEALRAGGNDRSFRSFVADTLVSIGGPAVVAVVQVLRAGDPEARERAAWVLGKIGDRRGVGALVRALGDRAARVRETAARALGEIGDRRAVKPLASALSEKDRFVRMAAARSLAELDDPDRCARMVALVGDADPVVRRFAAARLGRIGGKTACAGLVAALPDWDAGPAVCKALETLGWRPESDEAKVRFAVARRDFAFLNESRAIARKILLADAADGNNTRKATNAVCALIGLGMADTVPELVKGMTQHGTSAMAETFLNSGNEILSRAARAWGEKHSHRLRAGRGAAPVTWGEFSR